MNEVLSNKEIFRNVIAALKMTVRQFALKMGISYQRVFDLYSGRTLKAAPDIIEAMVNTYGINERYATLGMGEMFIDQMQNKEAASSAIKESPIVKETERQTLAETSEHQDEVIDPLTRMVASLSRQVKERDAYIRKLEDLLKANNIEF